MWLTVEGAAKHLGCTCGEIRRGYRNGRFPHVKLGAKYFLDSDALDEQLEREAEENQRRAQEACKASNMRCH
jgi:excisionase family DNA binding protein